MKNERPNNFARKHSTDLARKQTAANLAAEEACTPKTAVPKKPVAPIAMFGMWEWGVR